MAKAATPAPKPKKTGGGGSGGPNIFITQGEKIGAAAAAAIALLLLVTNLFWPGAGFFAGSPTVDGPVDKYIPVDVWVSGCPPRPQLIMAGIAQAAELLAQRKTADQKGKAKSC